MLVGKKQDEADEKSTSQCDFYKSHCELYKPQCELYKSHCGFEFSYRRNNI